MQAFVFEIKSLIRIEAHTLEEAASQFAEHVKASAEDLDFELSEEDTIAANEKEV